MKYNKNQKNLFVNGALWAVYNGLTSAFLIAFAFALGASNVVIGLLSAIPYISIVLSEFIGAKLVEFYSRKGICVTAHILAKFLWLPITLIPIFFKQHPIFVTVIFYFLIEFSEYLTDPAWTSLAADIVPEKLRGKFFAKRNMIIWIAMMITSIVAAFYLDLFPKNNLFGFASIFFVGLVFGLAAAAVFWRIKEPSYSDNAHYTLREFFSIEGDFRKFVFIVSFFYFAIMIASPFFTVYMLDNLGMSYTFFMVATAISILARIVIQTQYGRISDKYGDKPVAILSMFGTALIPLIYLFITRQNLWLIVPAQILSGLVWAGADLAIFNLLLDLSPQKRAVNVAVYSTITSIPMIVAPLIGGFIADNASFFLSGIPFVFTIAVFLRSISSLFMFSIKEPRAKKEHQVGEVFLKLISIHPIKGIENRIRSVRRK